MFFKGRTLRTIDAKGRLVLPPDFRGVLASRQSSDKVICTNFDGCVVGYPLPLWTDIEQKFQLIKNPSRQMRDFKRLFIGSAEEVEIDAQGRMRLSKAHIDYAQLDHEISLVGQGEKFEIWAQQRFNSLIDQNFDVADELTLSGLEISF